MKEKALNLGLAVYRVTKLYPGGEVLIGQTREIANQILSDLILGSVKPAGKKIEIILSYLKIAQSQDWVKRINFMILTNGYGGLLDEIRKRGIKKEGKEEQQVRVEELGPEQRMILGYAQKKEKFELKDLASLFPKKKSRTIRSYLKEMTKNKILIQRGRGRSSFYQINRAMNRAK